MEKLQSGGLILASVTYAMAARDLLLKYGIQSYPQRVPASYTDCGCGYGLAVKCDVKKADMILKAAKFNIKGYFDPV